MLKWFRQLDRILRGDATRMSLLREGEIRIPIGGLSLVIVSLGVLYGLCMGSFAMIRTGGEAYNQMIAAAVKVPLLFFLTLAVTFPSLYVFNALIGSRLSIGSALRLLVASLGVMLAALASLGPIIVFFAASTTSYPFMVLLNVATGTVAGVLGLAFLLRTLHRLVVVQEDESRWRIVAAPEPEKGETPGEAESADEAPQTRGPSNLAAPPPMPGDIDPTGPTGALDRVGEFTSHKARRVFTIWTMVFALVGAQMSWVLRPFIGDPDAPFQLFRERQSNFFLAVLQSLRSLFSS